MSIIMRGALLAATAGLLAGCSGSAEERINAAIPVSAEVASAKAAFDASAKAMKADTTELESDYAAQLKIRALECSRGHEPGMFASEESIRKDIGNEECFKAADAKLQQWLGMRRLGWLAAMPPLRPIPAKPAGMLIAPDSISQVALADQAGVAVLRTREAYVVVDLAGQEIRKAVMHDIKQISLSPNGRLLALSDEGEAKVLDTETGEVLTTLGDLRSLRVAFVGDKGLAYGKREGGIAYRDFGNGTETLIPISAPYLWSVVRPSANGQQYLLLGQTRMGRIELKPEGKGMKPTLINEEKITAGGGWEDVPPVAHNALVYAGGDKISRLDLATSVVDTVDFAPLRAQRIVPTPDPDVVLLSTWAGNGGGLYAFSFRAKTLAKIDTTSMLSDRLVYIPAANSNAMIDGAKLVMVGKLATAAPEALADVTHKVKFEAQLRQLEMMDRLQASRAANPGLAGQSPTSRYPSSASRYPSSDSRYGVGPNSRALAAPQRFSSGKAGLVEAMRAGVLRLGGPADLDAWKMAYMTKNRRMPGRNFEERMKRQEVYVVTGNMSIPSNLTGAHSVVFVVGQGAPFPQGDSGHSAVLDMGSGQCMGNICSMYIGND